MWSVYLLRCSDNTLYCGITNNVEKRVETHNKGKGAKYTKTRTPVKLVWVTEVVDRAAAAKLEWKLKQLSKKQKEVLLEPVSIP